MALQDSEPLCSSVQMHDTLWGGTQAAVKDAGSQAQQLAAQANKNTASFFQQ